MKPTPLSGLESARCAQQAKAERGCRRITGKRCVAVEEGHVAKVVVGNCVGIWAFKHKLWETGLWLTLSFCLNS